jgi:hypothetical protein
MPFRYPDRFALEYDGPELAYYTMAVNRPGSWFRTLRFGKVVDSNRLEVVALARFDGSPSWASAPTNRPGGLWLFEGADTEHELGIQADEMEIRFMFRYRNGSYQAGDWKRSPLLNELAVSTSTPERVYHNQEGR